jgi:hypothetical protein
MLGLNRMFNMNGFSGGYNPVSDLFRGTNSIFDTGSCSGNNFFTGSSNIYNACSSSYASSYKAMIGWNCASGLLGIGGLLLQRFVFNRNTEKTTDNDYSKETIQTDIKEIDKQINEQVDKLGCSSPEEALKCTVNPEIQNKSDKANEDFKKAQDDINLKSNTLKSLTASLEANKKKLKGKEKKNVKKDKNTKKDKNVKKNNK